MAQNVNFNVMRGDSFVIPLTFKDGDRAVINITGWTIFFTLKENADDSDANAKIQKTVTVHTSPTDGESKIELLAGDTDDLLGSYFYDVQYKKTDGTIKTLMKGNLTFLKDITRRIA